MRDIEDLYPLSPMQQGMVFHSLLSPDSGVYVEAASYRLRGDLDRAAFVQAWEALVARHAVLRTTFVWEGSDEPLQAVFRQVTVRLMEDDWRDLQPEEQERRLDEWLTREQRQGFAPGEVPLWRLAMIRLAQSEWALVWSHHHGLLDGWSSPILFHDLLALYEAARTGRVADLPAVRPYRDYIAWLREQDSDAAEEYWQRLLAGIREPTPLPVVRGESAESAVSGPRLHRLAGLRLSADSTEALRSLARRNRLTPGTVVQASWAELLRRYSGDNDILYGGIVSGRPAEVSGIETMVGMFINTLPVRLRIDPRGTTLDLLRQLHRQQVASRQFEWSSLVEIQGASEIPRSQPLFHSIFVYENYPWDDEAGGEQRSLEIAERGSRAQTNYPLTAVVSPGSEMGLQISFDPGLFENEAIERMLEHWRTLLNGMVSAPERHLAELPLLTPEERRLVIEEWNRTDAFYPAQHCLHHLFEQQAAILPDYVAVIGGERQLTFGELNRRANRVANHLITAGVQPETIVGLLDDRSPETIIGLLAILKAGGAYLPLDPTLPAERLRYMVSDARVSVVLTVAAHAGLLEGSEVKSLCLDRDWEEVFASEAPTNPSSGAGPANLAYVIYTSGSTGRPKGVMVEHRSVMNLLEGLRQEQYRPVFGPVFSRSSPRKLRVSLNVPIAFDASVPQWGALLDGHTVCLVPAEIRGDAAAMIEFIRRQRLDLFETVPSQLKPMLEAGLLDTQSWRPEMVIFGGEEIDEPTWHLLSQSRRPTFFNIYGPTEGTVAATLCRLGGSDSKPSIGRPLPNYRLYLLDRDLQPVPVGVPGELCVGGPGVARGYLNQPGMTAERFIRDPFSQRQDERLYRTGDRVRYLSDGRLEFLGRLDEQVKIRGLRIEPGEIEAVLREHASIAAAAVRVATTSSGDARLMACVVPSRRQPVSLPDLRQYLKGRLPSHMVPGWFVTVDSLPTLPNGKLDRRALPVPSDVEDEAAADPGVADAGKAVGPGRWRTHSEELMAAIWCDVLGLKRVGAEDDFFDLGGHSLVATRLVSRVREAFGVDLPLRALFGEATIRGLAATVDSMREGHDEMVKPVIPLVDREAELPLSFAQQRLWFLDQLEPESAAYNNPLALRLRGKLDVDLLVRALDATIARHEALRTTFAVSDGRPSQVIAPEMRLDLPVDDLSDWPVEEREQEVRRLAIEEAVRPFDLSRGPLLRARLLRLAGEEQILLATLHHIVSDGWSLDLLLREVTEQYRALSCGEAPRLAALPIQYADYACWQRERLAGVIGQRQLEWWRERLAGIPRLLELPTDRPRPAIRTYNGDQLEFTLGPELSGRLRALARKESATLFMALMAAFQTLMHRLSGQEKVVVGTPIANRTREDLEGLIGLFVNTLALPGDFTDDPTFVGLLARVRETALGAYANGEFPFERLVEALQPERDPGHAPLFQVMFMLQPPRRGEATMAGLTVEPLAIESRTARFDLTVEMSDGPDELAGTIEYNTDLFDRATIDRLVGHFHTLLTAITANPEERVSRLSLLTDEERTRIVETWNRTTGPFPDGQCFHDLFENRVSHNPRSRALVFSGEALSYGELNVRSNRLAHYLRRLGVGPETIVGLCAERSFDAIIAILGILKAGGAYLPLDPAYPRERLEFMFRDAGSSILVTQSPLLDRLPTDGARVVALDTEAKAIAAESEGPVASGAGARNAAYVIYTSGSTGRPKGVVLEHRGLCNLAAAQRGLFSLARGNRVLQFSPLSFDASVWEIAMSLAAGATLVLAPRETLGSLDELRELLRRERITAVTLPPSVLRLLDSGGAGEPDHLKVVISAGERCTRDLVQRWQPGRRFFNCYGPTEVTVCATAEICEAEAPGDPPIGRSLMNVETWVLDRHLQPVPIGVAGELCIGGVGLARGYLNRDDLTRERFVPHPFIRDRESRIYLTGDRVRYLADGRIEYLGRLDEQVKVRGHRIEPGEVESTLRECQGVREAVVTVSEDGRGDRRLVAWIVPQAEEMPPANELRQQLRARLPEHLVPSHFVPLGEVPLMPSGKVDRHALSAREAMLTESARHYIAPRSETEQRLAALWSDLLGVERIGVDDNFFELGGHSLLATQVISRMREAFGVAMPLRALFESPTLGTLAAAVENAVGEAEQPVEPAIVPVSRQGRRRLRSALVDTADSPPSPKQLPEAEPSGVAVEVRSHD